MRRSAYSLLLAAILASPAHAQQAGSLPRGLFGENARECQAATNGDENGARAISRDGKVVESFASRCSVRATTRAGATFSLSTTCQGEGQSWAEPIEIVVVNRDTLRWSERGSTRTLHRC
ncbi:MAG TPA: hypothetical protein PK812_11835 [Beijerinckiaceae bacterium]|nr:hypothetical protein [Beijerinckiaceae bacterium]